MDLESRHRRPPTRGQNVKLTWEYIRQRIKGQTRVSECGCWEWTGPLLTSGYGRLLGRMAHRYSYEAHIGPIPIGLDIDHLCRNRPCVNPEHLEPVTRKENLTRGIGIQEQKRRAALRMSCGRGHALAGDNVYIRPSDGVKVCRVCARESERNTRAKRKDELNAYKRAWRAQRKLQGKRRM